MRSRRAAHNQLAYCAKSPTAAPSQASVAEGSVTLPPRERRASSRVRVSRMLFPEFDFAPSIAPTYEKCALFSPSSELIADNESKIYVTGSSTMDLLPKPCLKWQGRMPLQRSRGFAS